MRSSYPPPLDRGLFSCHTVFIHPTESSMSDPVQSWLNNAGRFPLLPKSEILRLAAQRDKCEVDSAEYVKIVNKICQHNLRLIPNVVRGYMAKRSHMTMNSDITCDLLQQGYIGLRRAAEKYDSKRGFSFATYAHNWMYQSISRWFNSCNREIYVPENALTEALYRKRHGCPSKNKNGKICLSTINAVNRTFEVSSLDKKVGDDDDNTLLAIMSEEHRIISRHSTPVDDKSLLELKDLMSQCGIRPKTQDVVLLYTRRRRMSVVAWKMQLTEKHCTALYKRAVNTMTTFVEKKGIERKAPAVKLTHNQPQ